MACGLTESIFRLEVVGDVNMPQAGLNDKKLLLYVSGEQEPCVE